VALRTYFRAFRGVRFADDFVLGFENRSDAERFLAALQDRLHLFGLELHAEKTRLIEFGPHAIVNRQQRGEGRPKTFDFLGFTRICERHRKDRLLYRPP
jgi:hypothetical protein